VLFGLSYDYVGDLSETVALIWPADHGVNMPPPTLIRRWWRRCAPPARPKSRR
jgi:hypothetical protein